MKKYFIINTLRKPLRFNALAIGLTEPIKINCLQTQKAPFKCKGH